MIKVSIIVPVFNCEKYLEKCLDSLVNQTLKDIEIIIINDGSTDNSKNIIESYVKIHKNIIFINQENKGQAVARNKAIDISKGEYICFVDADDWISESMCEELYSYADNYEIIYCDYSLCFNNNIQIQYSNDFQYSDNEKVKYLLTNAGPCGKLIKTKIFIDNNIRFPEGIIYEDLAIIPTLCLYCDNIKYIKKNLCYYFQHEGSTTNKRIYNKKSKDIYKSISILEHSFKNTNNAQKLKSELEYMFVVHLLHSAGLKFYKFGKKEEVDNIVNIIREKFPNFRKNKYYKKMPMKDRICIYCIYKKKYKLLSIILRIKNIMFKEKN